MTFDHIEKWVVDKGYGFTRQKRFVHHTSLLPVAPKGIVLKEGTLVCGEVVKTEKGEQFTCPTGYGKVALHVLHHNITDLNEMCKLRVESEVSSAIPSELKELAEETAELTPQQIQNWRKLLAGPFGLNIGEACIGMLSDDDIRTIHRNTQARLYS